MPWLQELPSEWPTPTEWLSVCEPLTVLLALSVCEPYSAITNQNRHIWAKCVLAAVGIEPRHDYMVRHPQVHHRDAYYLTRCAVEKHTGRPFSDYVLSCRNEFPQGFAEFPTLSTVSRDKIPGMYEYREYDKREDVGICNVDPSSFQYLYRRDRDKVVEFWSHGGIERYKDICTEIMHGRAKPFYVK